MGTKNRKVSSVFASISSLVVTYDLVKHGKASSWPLRSADFAALLGSSPVGLKTP
jgi:hypothetical protein